MVSDWFAVIASLKPDLLERLNTDAKLAAGILDIFEHSSYFADELLRHPEFLEEVGEPFQFEGGPLEDGAALRRYYRRHRWDGHR